MYRVSTHIILKLGPILTVTHLQVHCNTVDETGVMQSRMLRVFHTFCLMPEEGSHVTYLIAASPPPALPGRQ